MSHLVLVDGNAVMYRAHYALGRANLRQAATGRPVWAVYGVIRILLELLQHLEPSHLIVGFDPTSPTFRHRAYPDYKAHRPPMPPELATQQPLVRHAVATMGIPIYECPGFEADDTLGTLAKQAAALGQRASIVTVDQDAMQLVDDLVRVVLPKQKTAEMLVFNRQAVLAKYGVAPEQFVDLKALQGDDSDNIPGVPKVGTVNATKLIQQFGSLAAVIANAHAIPKPAIRKAILEHAHIATMAYELARIDTRVPVRFEPPIARIKPPNEEALRSLLERLGFTSILREMPQILSLFDPQKETPPCSTSPARPPLPSALATLLGRPN